MLPLLTIRAQYVLHCIAYHFVENTDGKMTSLGKSGSNLGKYSSKDIARMSELQS